MKLSISYYSSCGPRERNEDAVSVLETKDGMLAVVADGLGGHGQGELASAMVVNALNQTMISGQPSEAVLKEAIDRANREIFEKHTDSQQMKSTVAALLLTEQAGCCIHVGDSRVYQFRDGAIVHQTQDHSVAQLAVLVGEITQDQLRDHPDQNKLVRAIGGPKEPKIDSKCLDVRPGDCFLLCSDGFWKPVTEQAMETALKRAESACHWLQLMRTDAQRETTDNHTAVAVMVLDS